MRNFWSVMIVLASAAGCQGGSDGESTATPGSIETCDGLGCSIVDCNAQGGLPTTISGTVYAPNGTLPLYGVDVYVPMRDPGPLAAGVQCGNCANGLPGGSYVQTTTDDKGRFTLYDVPVGAEVPVVLQVGKWRKQIKVTTQACQATELAAAQTTLPRTHLEGDIPQIAVTTGSADALDCLVRKLGIDDSEITTDAQGGRVHLFNGNGANQFAPGFAGGSGSFPAATSLWGGVDKLSSYDIVMLSCEAGQHPETKPQSALQAVHDYADRGGRVFLSHWHNIWVGGDQKDAGHANPEWQTIGDFDYGAPQTDTGQTTVVDEQENPKGTAFANWLQLTGATQIRGLLPVTDPRYTLLSVDPSRADRWVYVDPAKSTPSGRSGVQDMAFTTPQAKPAGERCGKVVFSDMHVSAGSSSKPGTPYPGGCSAEPLTPQEKALAFMFFDISSCVGTLQ